MAPSIKRLAREPLVHFLILGAGIFLVFQWRSRSDVPDAAEIVVTRARIDALATNFARTWQRPPTSTEMDGLIRESVREEAAAKEAAAMGLDQDDVIIRRRLRQKLEAVTESLVTYAEPTDADLRAWLAAHPEAYQVGARVTFSHVYLDPKRRGDALSRDAASLLARLDRRESALDITTLGDPFLLGQTFEAMPLSEVTARFGPEFGTRVGGLEPGRWHGPIGSAFGVHLVCVHDHAESRAHSFEDVRDAARRDWEAARRVDVTNQFYEALLQRYRVTIEREAAPGR